MEIVKDGASRLAKQAGEGIVWSIKQFGKGLVWLFENTIGLLITEAFGVLTNKHGPGWTMFAWGCLGFFFGQKIGGQDGEVIVMFGSMVILGSILHTFFKGGK